MSFRDVMDMPIRVFWVMNANTVRLQAELDIRALSIATACQSADGTKGLQERLLGEMGESARSDPLDVEVDHEGLEDLKRIVFRG